MSFARATVAVLAVAVFAVVSGTTVENQEIVKLEEYIAEQKSNVNQRYKLKYHISAQIGWINDPNGFSYYDGEYHMFYQYHPYSAEWGPMHWGHVKSQNLVEWIYLPTALLPEEEYDIDGCFSGSAVEENGELILLYTGNVNSNESETGTMQYQNIATSRDGVNFQKYAGNPVISQPPDGVNDFRDPKVWRHGENWYMILGNATPDKRGRVVLYESRDLYSWTYRGVVAESDGSLGYMWECPDMFELGDKHILLMSPQGVEPQGDRYKNLYQTGYLVGDFNYENNDFRTNISDFQELDFGHDFYASQTTVSPDGRRIVMAWMAMWESDFPEQVDGWAGAMTLPRVLTLDPTTQKLLMTPIHELYLLRKYVLLSGQFEKGVLLTPGINQVEFEVRADLEGNENAGLTFHIGGDNSVKLVYDATAGSMSLDRGGEDGVRQAPWRPQGELRWRIFVDTSSVEVFCGDGEAVFSSRMYPTKDIGIEISEETPLHITAYALKQTIDL